MWAQEEGTQEMQHEKMVLRERVMVQEWKMAWEVVAEVEPERMALDMMVMMKVQRWEIALQRRIAFQMMYC